MMVLLVPISLFNIIHTTRCIQRHQNAIFAQQLDTILVIAVKIVFFCSVVVVISEALADLVIVLLGTRVQWNTYAVQ